MKLLSILRARHCEGHCDIPNLFLKPILVTLNKTFRFLPQLNCPDVTIFIVLVNLTCRQLRLCQFRMSKTGDCCPEPIK